MMGKKFGKLTVLSESGSNERGVLFYCLCECGNKVTFPGKDLRSDNNKSCGCLNHGMTGTRPYHIWGNMKKRCDNPNSPDYPRYGGRGISYTKKWGEFIYFWNDMKDNYSDNLTLDRIDNDKGYSKENCRWVSKMEQSNNTRQVKNIVYKGKEYTITELARMYNINRGSLANRLKNGWSVNDALNETYDNKERLSYKGEIKTVGEWAQEKGMTYHQLKKRLMRGWSIEKAIEQPLRKR